MAALVTGIQVADERSGATGSAKKRARALGLTLGAIVFLGIVFSIAAFLPALVDDVVGDTGEIIIGVLRWPVLAVVTVLGIGLLYRFADPAVAGDGSAL